MSTLEDIGYSIQEVVGKTPDRNTVVTHISITKKYGISLYVLIFLYILNILHLLTLISLG